mmetsp:Transcript_72596/g.151556  ORF Transcript_72596/g.151556 Transcript_72596/m.151556 type:complete len:682 (+) Transcript_72596:165-2210(+)
MGACSTKQKVDAPKAKDKQDPNSSSKHATSSGGKGQAITPTASTGPPKPMTPKAGSFDPTKPILGRYKMSLAKEDIMGKGTSSICRKGKDLQTGKMVAIKLYKEQVNGGRLKDTTLQKYKRQISVLEELQEPFKPPADKRLWNDQLNKVKPSQLFMQLLDYSKDETGEPGPDSADGMLYVITELAQYSLKDFLADRREKQKTLSKEAVRDLSKRIILAMAGLHAKGFVHIDMKPENLMVFDGRLKVIDVDGCVRMGTSVSINDGSISFSPCYCAPEWARFMIKDSEQAISAHPCLDVWSVGMTLCEFVTLDAIWKPQYANFMRNAQSHKEAGFLFLEWLGDIKKPPLPKAIEKFDPGFVDLLFNWLLVCDKNKRQSCAEAIMNPYLAEGGWDRYGDKNKEAVEEAPTRRRNRAVDDSDLHVAPIFKATLWKLNTGANPKDNANWLQRDMWVAKNHSLCYFSTKENKRLVLIEGDSLEGATINRMPGLAKEFAFEVTVSKNDKDGKQKIEKYVLAADSHKALENWEKALGGADDMFMTFKLGNDFAEDVQAFRLAVRNRRMKVEGDKGAFEPAFRAKLWKLKTGGDRQKEGDWFLRDMWIAKNGSLVYWSERDERELIYYTAADVARATLELIPDGGAFKLHAFKVQLAASNGVEFDPGEFAAETADMRQQWVHELSKCMGS